MSEQTNGFDRDQLKGIVGEIQEELGAILSIRMQAMSQCKRHHESIGDIKKRAKGLGIPVKELNALLKNIDLHNKIEDIRAKLDEENQVTYDMLLEAFGDFADTPLAQAAIEQAPKAPRSRKKAAAAAPANGADLDSLH